MGRLKTSTTGRFDLGTAEGLERFAVSRGLQPPKENRALSALRTVGGILNVGAATTAGAVRGAIRPDISVLEGAKKGFEERETFGFGDVIREDLGLKPDGRLGKIAVGTTGFIADVVFDPITYLTFGVGAGIKVGGRTLTKTGTQLARRAGQELIGEGTKRFLKKGVSLDVAQRLGQKRVSGTVNELFLRATGKKGLTQEAADEFLKRGISEGTIKQIGELGTQLLDKGGIQFFGKTLVTSKTLAKTPIGKAAKALGQSEIVQALKNTLSKTFIADFGKNKKLVSILDKASRAQRRAFQGIIEANEKLFKGLNDDEMSEFFNTVFSKKLEVALAPEKFSKLPKPKFKNVFDEPEKIEELRIQIKELEPIIKESSAASLLKFVDRKTGELPEVLGKGKTLFGRKGDDIITELGLDEKKANELVRQLIKNKDDLKNLKGELTELRKSKTTQITGKQIDEVNKILQDVKNNSLTRKEVKAQQKTERLVFDNPKLQSISDQLFEGKDAIMPRFAKAAGIPEEEAIKFYIPSKFQDKLKIKDFAMGRNLSSPSLGFQKKFTGVEKGIIRDPFEAFSRGQTEVVTARIKTRATESVIKSLGKPLKEFGELEAKRRGFVKFSRKGIEGKVEGWLPEAVADELNKFLKPELKTIDELARVTGFDWATGLFKGYVTSLFPGFYMRNITSNQFQNSLKIGVDVLNPALQKRALDIVQGKNLDTVLTAKTGKKITMREVREAVARESEILDADGAFGRFEQLLEEGKQRISRKKAGRLNPLSRENVALQFGRKVGQRAEEQAKLVSILSAVMEGKTVKQGIEQAEEALFNYRKLTEFERSVMRRLIPFYTFARKNFELQLKTLATNPGKIAAQIKGIRGLGEAVGEPVTQEDIEGLPDFVLEGLGIKAGANKFGQSTFFTGLGLPIEEFLQRMSGKDSLVSNTILNTISQMNPLIKYPVEKATNKDFFRNRPITDITNAQSLQPFISFLDSVSEPVSQEIKDLVQWVEIPNQPVFVGGKVVARETRYRANPFALHLFRNMFTSRIQSTVGFLGAEDESLFNKGLRAFSGVRGWSIDQEEQKFFNDLDRKRQLEDYLIRMGVLRKFEKAFVPKK